MKIAVVTNIPIHYQQPLFRAMRAEGLDLDVLFLASGSTLRYEDMGVSQELYRHRVCYQGAYESAPPIRKSVWTWINLNQTSPKAVLVSSYYAAECWSAWLWTLIHRVPLVMWFESNEFDYPRHWLKELPKRLFLRGLVGAHVYGLSNKAYLVKLGLSPEDIATKRAVVDVEKFATAACEKTHRAGGTTRLLYVGRLAEIKNVSFLIRSFAKATRSQSTNLRLTLVGKGPCEQALRDEVSQLGIDHLVEFKGYVEQKDLAAHYRQADFFVLPSVREPWGLVALEAMLCRLPVLISSQCGCAIDLVRPATGWVFDPWHEESLVSLLSALAAIPDEKIRAMGGNAHELAMTYSPENCAKVVANSVKHLRDRSSRLGSAFDKEYASYI